jgi:exosome complex component RRP41
MRIQMGPVQAGGWVAGSALVEMGLTVALARSRRMLSPFEELSDRAILDVTVKTAPFAPSTDRRVTNPNTDRRLIETAHMLKQALEASVLLQLYPKSRIEVAVCILADDGGRLCAAINAATLALMDAGIPMKDFVCACSAGYSVGNSDQTLVDLNLPRRIFECGPTSCLSSLCTLAAARNDCCGSMRSTITQLRRHGACLGSGHGRMPGRLCYYASSCS